MDFVVTKVEPVRLAGPKALTDCQLMSPYVWVPVAGTAKKQDDGDKDPALAMLLRAVPPVGSTDTVTGRIWFARGDADGLSFTADPEPLIVPGPGPDDIGGCEDPTVVPTALSCLVYYTGLSADGAGQMLYASGPDVHSMQKRGVALSSFKTESNTKEATVEVVSSGAPRTGDQSTVETQAPGDWRLFYEYAQDDRSKIGLAFGEGPAGPWTEQPQPFAARPDNFDNWHLSTGPLSMADPKQPVMFYNGASRDARWGIGWVAFSEDLRSVVARCEGPLLAPPGDADVSGRRIVFAASLLEGDGVIHLYLSRDDRELVRATLERR